jgi:hypothetical protein
VLGGGGGSLLATTIGVDWKTVPSCSEELMDIVLLIVMKLQDCLGRAR